MKKCVWLLVLCAFAVSSLFGCAVRGGGGFDEELLKEIDLTADGEFSGELNIRTWSEESEVLIMNSLIRAFQKEYPYIRINYTQDYLDNYYSSLTSDFGVAEQTGDFSGVPDLFWMSQDMIDSFYNLDNIMFPLTKIDEIDESFSSEIFADEALSTCSVDGTMYILPRDFSQVVMFFNQDIFDAAGVAYPTPQMSQDAFMKMLADLRTGLDRSEEKNDYNVPYKDAVTYLVDVNAMWDSWCWPVVRSFGGMVVDGDGNAALNSPEVWNAVKFWKEMRDKNYAGPISTMNVGVNFRMQQSAIYFHTRSVMTSIFTETKQIKGVKNLGVTALPQFGTEYSVGSGASGYSMYMKSEHKTAAWLFLKFIASEAGQNAFCASGNGIPSVKSMLNAPDAAWRTYRSEAFGTAFDNDAFVYGMELEKSPYTSTREFFRYIPIERQQDVLACLRTCFLPIDSENNSEANLKENIANQNELIKYYLKQS